MKAKSFYGEQKYISVYVNILEIYLGELQSIYLKISIIEKTLSCTVTDKARKIKHMYINLPAWCFLFHNWQENKLTSFFLVHNWTKKMILSLKSISNSWGNFYIPYLLIIIMHRFTCGKKKIWQNITILKILWPLL